MSGDFDIKNSKWWNVTGLERAARWVRDDSIVLTGHSKTLLEHNYSPEADKLICDAETALTEALLAVKLTKKAYQKKRGPVLAIAN